MHITCDTVLLVIIIMNKLNRCTGTVHVIFCSKRYHAHSFVTKTAMTLGLHEKYKCFGYVDQLCVFVQG